MNFRAVLLLISLVVIDKSDAWLYGYGGLYSGYGYGNLLSPYSYSYAGFPYTYNPYYYKRDGKII